jgi:hypothetical protein
MTRFSKKIFSLAEATFESHFLKIRLVLSSHLRIDLPRDVLTSGFQAINLRACLTFSLRAARHAHFILTDVTILS